MNRTFAISDIHGCFNPFHNLIINVLKLKKSDKLILLGDYIDRGDKSKEVIDFIIDLSNKGFDVTPLMGNHEVMLIDTYSDPNMLPLWVMNSGLATLKSLCIQDIRYIDNQYINFFVKLKYYETIGDFIFVHAGFNDLAADPFTDKHGMIWESSFSYANPVFFGKTIIHGHRPKTINYIRKLINEKSKVIPIDTGCVYEKELGYGNLSALEVNTMNLISVPNL
jgi:serine/threonine protein phosphatase 1